MRRIALLTCVAACLLLCRAVGADPVTLDLTSGGSGVINGAVFEDAAGGAGTGIFDSFVRIKAKGTEEGFNTDAKPQMDTLGGTFTHSIQLFQIPVIAKDGKEYFEFLLDINENKNGGRYLSLEAVKIYTNTVGDRSLSVPDEAHLPELGALRYDMDGDGDSAVLMDFNFIDSGSGTMDIRMLVPVYENFLLQGVLPTDFIYLYSKMGSTTRVDGGVSWESDNGWGSDAGFEEWAAKRGTVYLPDDADWGDAPDEAPFAYRTSAANDGPFHRSGLLEWLGTDWDGEPEGVPSTEANSDDDTGVDDEDGVKFVTGGVEVTMTVYDRANGRYGSDPLNQLYLDGWLDVNRDGDFDDQEDHIWAESYDPSDDATWGTSDSKTVFVPLPWFSPRKEGDYFRWRLNYGAANLYYGESTYGEVEDYYVTPEPTSLALLGLPLVLLARRRRRK